MEDIQTLEAICVVFVGALVAATAALVARQALIVGYLIIGAACGPHGLKLIDDPRLIEELSHIGIIFLLYLLGLSLQPRQLFQMLGEAFAVTAFSSLFIAALVAAVALVFAFAPAEAVIVGAAMMFSSTIIGLKLLPTTTLHHKHAGQVVVSVLLLQDVIAIAMLVLLETYAASQAATAVTALASKLVALPLLFALTMAGERWVVEPLISRFDQIQEYVFLLVIAWCLGVSVLAAAAGLSPETGAFVAGVALASSPVSPFIAETLRPLRDFFLIMFFFALGAEFDVASATTVIVPALLIAAVVLAGKPLAFRALLLRSGEQRALATEVGVRLGQASEFALLIGFLALHLGLLSDRASDLIQLSTLLTFVVSSYLVVLKFPTPIGMSPRLRRD